MLADVRRLASDIASSSRDPVVEASSRVQGAGSASGLSASSSRGLDSYSAPGRGSRGRRPERILLVAQIIGATPRVVKVKRKREVKCQKASGSRGENFIPWILDIEDEP